ncbi:MAG: potassium/proton antiporter [Kiloniellales bacterium]
MAAADHVILITGILLLASILAGVASSRVGAPLLLVFLVLGMLLGEDGPGGVLFDDFRSAYLIGSLALAIILFDGGYRTPLAAVRVAWQPAALLATLGVVVTAAITGAVAWLVLQDALLAALLVGAIVGSTDAAAVFLLLHQQGMQLRRRVSATLEVESGVNDPMAVFLTVSLVSLIANGTGTEEPTLAVVENLVWQLGLGALAGGIGGFVISWVANRLELAPGLYPVLVVAAAFVVFGGTQTLGGSGFLAVYLAGIISGNRRMRATKLVRRFHDGIAWISQIVMFLMLGLLVTPSKLLPDVVPAAVIAFALIFLARPVAVGLCLLPFRFGWEERLFIAWVGLRGAVPIYLAIIPVLGGVPNSAQYFNVAFLVVLASLLLQGWTIPWVARLLDVEVAARPEPSGKLDFDMLSQLDRDVVGYLVNSNSSAAGKPIEKLSLPPRTRILVVLRENFVVPLQHLKELQPGDYVLVITPPEQAFLLDSQFLPRQASRRRDQSALGDFAFAGDVLLSRVAVEYDLPVSRSEGDQTLADYLSGQLGSQAAVGDAWRLGDSALIVREIVGNRVTQVGLRLEASHSILLPSRFAEETAAATRWLGGLPQRLAAVWHGGFQAVLVRLRGVGRTWQRCLRAFGAPLRRIRARRNGA